MAELLFKAIDATNSNSTKDQRGCYKRGDLVVVKDDNWGWGSEETNPPSSGGKFVIIKITDVTANQVNNYCNRKWGISAESPDIDASGFIRTRRRISIPLSILPNAVKTTLNITGTYSNTWSAIRQYFTDKLTNTTGSGDAI